MKQKPFTANPATLSHKFRSRSSGIYRQWRGMRIEKTMMNRIWKKEKKNCTFEKFFSEISTTCTNRLKPGYIRKKSTYKQINWGNKLLMKHWAPGILCNFLLLCFGQPAAGLRSRPLSIKPLLFLVIVNPYPLYINGLHGQCECFLLQHVQTLVQQGQ